MPARKLDNPNGQYASAELGGITEEELLTQQTRGKPCGLSPVAFSCCIRSAGACRVEFKS
ncbi:MAG: hypothetical protein LBD80_06295 [Tannerella sp.]|nr:hypothetical protein [Tannerella sp.]